jgi:hypothetical protein
MEKVCPPVKKNCVKKTGRMTVISHQRKKISHVYNGKSGFLITPL